MIRSTYLLATCLAVAVCAVGVGRPANGQTSGWQPYRDPLPPPETLADAAGVDAPLVNPAAAVAPVQVAQVPCDPALVCPTPMYAAPASPAYGVPVYVDPSATGVPQTSAFWQWRVLPEGVVWQSYWAGAHEPRISGVTFFEQDGVALLDVTLGGRASLLRYGTDGPGRPMGAELQIEGAAFPRLNLDENWDVEATDFRFGLPLVYGREQWEAKFSYYHLSAHMGDEFAIREDALDQRINFSRDCLALALAVYPLPAWRWYAETAWAFHYDDGAEPWEFQFGVDVAEPGPTGPAGAPFFSINGHLREEHNFGGNVVFQAGWLWRGNTSNLMRVGFHYFNGKSNQFEFFDQFEEQLGGGVWYEF
jgi:hypothetical protein